MRSRRGHVLLLLTGAIAAIGVLGFVVAQRAMLEVSDRRESSEREQALWLARSAASRGRAGDWSVPLEPRKGRAHVTVSVAAAAGGRRAIADASMPAGGQAQVEVSWDASGQRIGWHERYARGP